MHITTFNNETTNDGKEDTSLIEKPNRVKISVEDSLEQVDQLYHIFEGGHNRDISINTDQEHRSFLANIPRYETPKDRRQARHQAIQNEVRRRLQSLNMDEYK